MTSVHKIKNAVGRIKSISKEMRASLIGDYSFEKIDIAELINLAIEDLGAMFQKHNIEYRGEVTSLFDIIGNRSQLQQVFINLIRNSIEAIANQDDKWIEINQVIYGQNLIIQIKDSGPGIPKEERNKIFTSLYTTKLNSGGTGLGLSICKKIIEAHNGTIEVDPDSKNTQFNVYFNCL